MSLFILDTDALTPYYRGDPIVVRNADAQPAIDLAITVDARAHIAYGLTLIITPHASGAESMALENVFQYFGNYDKSSFYVVACQGNQPSDADVAAFEANAGLRLPDEFREFTMSPLGGLYMEVLEELWPRPKPYEVGPFWSFLYALKVFGIAEGIPDWLDIRVQYAEFKTEGFGDLVPFLQLAGDADKYCFDSSGRIIRWSHEEPENREREPVTFSELLMRGIHALEDRKDRKISEPGSEA